MPPARFAELEKWWWPALALAVLALPAALLVALRHLRSPHLASAFYQA